MSTYSAAVLATSGLVSYWRLGEPSGTNAADANSTNAGTYTGGFTLGATGALLGDPDTAVTLNGSTGYITVPDATNLHLAGDLTLEAWVNPTDRANYYPVVTKNSANIARPFEWRLEQTTGKPTLVVDTANTELKATNAPPTGAWSHIAVTVSGTTYTHYLNGAVNGTGTITQPRQTDAGLPLFIGARNDLALFFKGSIDEVAAYNAALSGATVLDHYTKGTTAPPTVTTLAASNIGPTGATLNASVNPNGKSTTAQFEYGLTTGYGTNVSLGTVGSDSVDHALNTVLSGLTTGVTYHYRISATNSDGTSVGSDVAFIPVAAAISFVPAIQVGLWTFDACDGSGNVLTTLTRNAGTRLTFTRNGVPECELSLSHDDDECAAILTAMVNGTGGGMPTLKGYRVGTDGTKVLRFNGYLAAISEESGTEASTATFTFKGPFARLLGDGNNRGRFTAVSVAFTATDAGQIAKSLIDTTNAVGTTGIVTGGSIEASKNRDRVYQSANVGESIVNLTNVLDGFDFEVLPVTSGPQLSPPTFTTLSGGGGNFYVVTAVDGSGETTASTQVRASSRLAWNAVLGAVAYRVYGSAASGQQGVSPAFFAQTTGTSYTVSGGAKTGAAPSTNTTGGPGTGVGLFTVYASQGSDQPAAKFEYGTPTLANCAGLHRQTLPPINSATVIGANGLTSTKTNAASISKYGLWPFQGQFSDVTDQSTLDDKANANLRPNPVKAIDFTPDPALGPRPFDDYWIGDTVYFYASRTALVEPPLGVRVNQITVVIDPDTGLESAEIPDPLDPSEERAIRASLQAEVVP